MELIGTEYKYDLAMNVTGFACNVLLRAYKTENGERVYYPDFDKYVLCPDALTANDDLKQAAIGINQIIQWYITKNNL